MLQVSSLRNKLVVYPNGILMILKFQQKYTTCTPISMIQQRPCMPQLLRNTSRYQFPLNHFIIYSNNNNITPYFESKQYQYQIRYKHGAKKGLHLQKLNEMAHEGEHIAAQERKMKKKEKTALRKGTKGGNTTTTSSSSSDPRDELDGIENVDIVNNRIVFKEHQSNINDENWVEPDEDEEEHDENVLPNPNEVKQIMMKHVDVFKDYLRTVRGGQRSAEMFDDIMVRDAYGHGTGDVTVKAVAQIVMSTPTLAIATCFDPATTKAVSNAIRDALELNPQIEEGTGTMKIPIPRISMEVRQQIVSNIQKRAENFRIRIRNSRRKALDIVKQGVAGKLDGVSKDDAFRVQQEIESMADIVIKELNKVLEKKESDIMSI